MSRNLWDTLRLLASDAPLCLAALLCADVPWVLLANFSSLWPSSWHALRGSLDPQVFAGLWAAGAVTVHTVLAPFGAALVTYRALARLEGRRATLGETFRRTAPRLPAVLLAAVLSTALSALGMLLAFPGLIAMSALYVVTPVAVAEPTSGIGALRRSFRLTAGYRGRAFLLLVVLFAPLALLKLGLDAWCRGAEPGSSEYLAPTTTALFLAGRVCADVLSALSSAAAYMGLRRAFNERTSQDAPEAPEENAPSHAPATR